MRRMIAATALLLACGSAGDAWQSTTERDDKALNLTAYAELLRSDIRTQKVAILTEVMGFSEAEDAVFWPIYRECDVEMSKLSDERLALIRDYAAKYTALTDADASSLASRAIDLESKRDGAKARCFEKVKTATSPRTALRFLQVEHQLQLLIDLQIASSLPVAPAGPVAPARKELR